MKTTDTPFLHSFRATLPLFLFPLAILIALLQSGCVNRAPVTHDTPSETMLNLLEDTWNIKGISDSAEFSFESLLLQFGAQIAIDEINANGGINGVMLAFCIDDSVASFRISATDTAIELLTDSEGLLLVSVPRPTEAPSTFEGDTTHSSIPQFIQKYKQMYGSEPDACAFSAYHFIYLLKDVLEQSDVCPDIDASKLADIFAKTAQEITFEELSKYTMPLNESDE